MLNCIVMCRSMDKKSYDNILERTSNTSISDVLTCKGGNKYSMQELIKGFRGISSKEGTINSCELVDQSPQSSIKFMLNSASLLGMLSCPFVR